MAARLARLSYSDLVDAAAALVQRRRSHRLSFAERVTLRKILAEIRRRERVAIIAAQLLGEPLD